ncbi:F-type H+-transporting ATPase subunit b [Rhizomicrobium palustre]|uniref:ATP synthase subunit b n=1 Tax=Rhizomicrobium palustre TaxID=189966 RepID=A0A846N3U2_9PROT|nr:F0F1 ATP synthase subunit B' [Rhizomicrobium palustre]NIK90179.1 F-type H+-transporting ATPase subunit b [Rhizomicrobium palustre]
MSAEPVTHTGTEAQHSAGFPPFKTESFPSQIFWLVVTFAALFIVLWRLAGPRIAGVIGARKGQIEGDLAAAEKHRADAEAALAAYETALADARVKAHAEAEANRKVIEAEVEKAKAEADAEAREAAAKAEAGIAAARAEAATHVTKAAQDAAADIVNRLIGVTVTSEQAEAAVKAVGA